MAQHNTIDHTGLTGVSTVSYASNANQTSTANYGGAATTVSRGDHVHLSTGGAGNVATDAIWTTAGKVAVATGTATATEQWPPGHQFDYVEITSPVAVTATTEAGANTVVTGSAVTYDGSTAVLIEFFAEYARPDITARTLAIYLYDGAGSIGRLGIFIQEGSVNSLFAPVYVARKLTPSAASHTYSIRASVGNAVGGTVSAGAGGSGNSMPAFIRITKV